MARLGPGIGVEQVGARKACVGEAFQHLQRIVHMDADIVESLPLDVEQQADHAIQERFAADEAVIGAHRRLAGEMLAAAEADLELQGTIVAEQGGGIERPGFRNRDPREKIVDKRLLAHAQLVPLATAIEAADG
jgi:hypothetical protein